MICSNCLVGNKFKLHNNASGRPCLLCISCGTRGHSEISNATRGKINMDNYKNYYDVSEQKLRE